MRRHPALVRLSDEHHHELVQARRLQRAAEAEPDERLRVAEDYVAQFFGATTHHFRREEEAVFPLYTRHAGETALVARILREHMELHGLARELRAEVAVGDVSPQTLATLGSLLRDHVRVEERELFEEIQRVVPDVELASLQGLA